MHVGFNRVGRKVQLVCDSAIGRPPRDDVYNLELRIGETVPTHLRPLLADNAPFDAQSAQLAAHAARIGERFEARVCIEGRIELIKRLVLAIGQDQLAAGILCRRGVEKWPRRRPK